MAVRTLAERIAAEFVIRPADGGGVYVSLPTARRGCDRMPHHCKDSAAAAAYMHRTWQISHGRI